MCVCELGESLYHFVTVTVKPLCISGDSADTPRTTLKAAVPLPCISISRKGQYSNNVIVIQFAAQVISPVLTNPNQSARRGSQSCCLL